MQLPSKIAPCPIVDALLEVRFTTQIPPNAVYGVVYNALKDNYPATSDLPILQIPEPIRKVDANFRFKPLYKAHNDRYVLQIGPDVITISSYPEYVGWSTYSQEIIRVLGVIRDLGLVKSVLRVGYHVVNFFDEDVYPKTKLSISIGGNEIEYTNTVFKTTDDDPAANFRTVMQVSNEANYNKKPGSIIDIDSFTMSGFPAFGDVTEALINSLHIAEKRAFYTLLSDEYVRTLSPEYD